MMGDRLMDYYHSKGVLPASIRQYLVDEGFRLTDEWGNPYTIEASSERFSISSWGSDHRIGGVGDATDIVVRWQADSKGLTVNSADIQP